MASIEKRGKKYIVRWRTLAGAAKGRTCPDHDTAKKLQRLVEAALALGEDWEPEEARAEPVASPPALLEFEGDKLVGGMFLDYLEAQRAFLSPGSHQGYNTGLLQFASFLADRHPGKARLTLDLLTREALEAFYSYLVSPEREPKPLAVGTARNRVIAVRSCWEWAYDSDTYSELVSRPRRVRLPKAPRTPAAAPTWEEMDRVVRLAYARAETGPSSWTWRARLLTLLRFTGLRVDAQLMRLRWEDVDLERKELTIRGELGKSEAEREGRIVPLSPHLVQLMAGWGVRDGYLIAPGKGKRSSAPALIEELWREAKVPERIWGKSAGRKRTSVHHAFRRGLKTGLADLDVEALVRDYLVGHNLDIDAHYLELARKARRAVALIPPLYGSVPQPNAEIVELPQRASS